MRLHILPQRRINPALIPRPSLPEKLQHIRIQPNRNLLLIPHRNQRSRPSPLDSPLRRNIAIVDLAALQRAQLFLLCARQLWRIRRIKTKPHHASSLLFHICQPLALISVASCRRASYTPRRSLAHNQSNCDPALFIKTAFVESLLPVLIRKNQRCQRKGNAMLSTVGSILLVVP